MVFSFEETTKFPTQILLIKYYLIEQGFCGLILYPIFISFGSLIVFYLIGVAAQIIKLWVGKRLPAQLMGKFDTGNYELKSVSDNYKKLSKQYFSDLRETESELDAMKSKSDSDDDKILKLSVKVLDIESKNKAVNLENEEKDYRNKEMKEAIREYEIDLGLKDREIVEYKEKLKDYSPFLPINIKAIFGSGKWKFQKFNMDGTIMTSETVSLIGNYLRSSEKSLTYPIENVEINSKNNLVTFIKGVGLDTKLIIVNPELLIGTEGILMVKYQRL